MENENFAGFLLERHKYTYFQEFWGREAGLDWGDMTRLGSQHLINHWLKARASMKNTGLHQKNNSFLTLPVDGLIAKKRTDKDGGTQVLSSATFFEFFINAFGER